MKLTYLFSTFVLLVSGLVIWSCSQEETEDVMTVYRYSPEEIATLRSMAEEYGIPNVKFITESATELPTMNEMKEAMYKFSLLKHSISMPMELVDSSSTNIVYQSKRVTFDRLRTKRSSGEESSSIKFDVMVENWPAVLTYYISWVPVYTKDVISDYSLTITGNLELPIQLEPWYSYKNHKITYDKRPNESVTNVTYECELMYYDSVNHETILEEKLSFTKTVNIPSKPSLN